MRLSAGGRKAIVDSHIATFRPSKLLKRLSESGEALFHLRIVFSEANQHTDASHPLSWLRPCRYRPCPRATNKAKKFAPPHSITSSARARSVGGIVTPRAFAVLVLTTSSYLVGAWTGSSPGAVPRRMRST